MTNTLNQAEESQLLQTIEMFEVITQSQPNDYQSLEILKEAYAKLGREKDAIQASKKIADAYVAMGQLSLAILEYEMILQRYPDDKEVQAALAKLENKTNLAQPPPPGSDTEMVRKPAKSSQARAASEIDDGRQGMYKLLVDGKIISPADFEASWPKIDPENPPSKIIDPFIQKLSEKGVAPLDKTLKLLADKTRLGFLPLEKYDIDMELVRTYGREVCLRWCVVPFDKMGKTVMVGTANPFNKEATRQLEAVAPNRFLLYLCPPPDLVRILGKVFK